MGVSREANSALSDGRYTTMEKFVAECNIERFRKRLERATTHEERLLVGKLLEDEQNRLLYFTDLEKHATEIKKAQTVD